MSRRRTGTSLRRRPRSPRLEALEVRRLLATFVVTSIEDSLQVPSLRWAINQANASVNESGQPDVIEFDIPGDGVHTIRVNSPLPPILDAVIIDGTSQPGYSVAQPSIVISGANLPTIGDSSGLRINSPSTVRGLTINQFPGYGIKIQTSGSVVESSFLGTNAYGTGTAGNGRGGILIDGGGKHVIGSSSGAGNLISGNGGAGIRISSTSGGENLILGNVIGLDRYGNQALANDDAGILVEGGNGNQVGGVGGGHRNVIAGNGQDGVRITGNASGTVVAHNQIGTNFAGTQPLGNGRSGIRVEGSTGNRIGVPGAGNVIAASGGHGVWLIGGHGNVIEANRIGTDGAGVTRPGWGNAGSGIVLDRARGTRVGGTNPGAGNVIAASGGHGVVVLHDNAVGNEIRGNTIFANAGIGIDLGHDGRTANDLLDADSGPNLLQNTPVLARAETALATDLERTLIAGTMHSRPDSHFTIEFFANGPDSPQQGQRPIGFATVRTDAAGDASFQVSLPARTLVGQNITATATDSDGNTSEFSAPVVVVPADAADLALTIDAPSGPALLPLGLEYLLTVRNVGIHPAVNARLVDTLDDPASGRFVAAEILAGAAGGFDLADEQLVVHLGTLAPGAMVQIRVRVEPAAPGVITYIGEVLLDNLDARLDNNVVAVSTTVTPEADLAVRFLDEPIEAIAGEVLAYPIEVVNLGPGPATGVALTAALAPGTVFVDAVTHQGSSSYDASTHKVAFTLGDLPANEPLVVRLLVRPGADPTTWIELSVEANENTPRGGQDDNDRAFQEVDVAPSADLGVTIREFPSSALTGQEIAYVIDVHSNAGPSDAANAVLTAHLPVGTTLVSASHAPETVHGRVLSFAMGTLGSGQPGTQLTLVARVESWAAGPLQFRAEIDSEAHDPAPGNNVAEASSLLDPADVGLVLASPVSVDLGVPFRYEATIHNHGPAPAGSLMFLFNLPVGLEFQPSSSTPGLAFDPATRRILLDLTDLPSEAAATVEIAVLPRVARVLTASAGVALRGQPDPSIDNNIRVSTTHAGSTDVSVAFEGGEADAIVNVPTRLIVKVGNHGPRTANRPAVAIPIPANAELVATEAIAGTTGFARYGDTLVARFAPLAVGGSASFAITLVPRAEGNLTLAAIVGSEQPDESPANNTASVTLAVRNAPGRLQFRQAVYAADEGSVALVTVERVGGTRGTIATFYEVIGGTARPGVDFTPTGNVLIFLDGETTKTFTVPIYRDGVVTDDRTIGLALCDIGFGGVGPIATATIVVREIDVDVTPPHVSDVQFVHGPNGVVAATVVFNERMDPVRASDPKNYVLLAASGAAVPVTHVEYDVANWSARLTLARPLPAVSGNRLLVNGNGPGGVADWFGNILDGDRDGVSGGNFVAVVARGANLNYADDNGDLVDLRLSGGGTIEQVRGLDGTVYSTRVIGASPGRSVLSGNVRRAGSGGDGITSLGSLSGIGSFGGGAISRLTSPPFYATNGPLPTAIAALRLGRTPAQRLLSSR